MKSRIPKPIRDELDATGIDWDVQIGGKHFKVVLGGKMVAILPRGSSLKADNCRGRRATLNTIAQVRRTAKELRG